MKKLIFIFGILFAFSGQAQKIAFVDTEKILDKIPEYKSAQEKLDELAIQYQKEIKAKQSEVNKLNSSFQADKILLSKTMRLKRKEEIQQAENDLSKIRQNNI